MNAHIIENGRVVSTIVVDSLDAIPGLHLVDAAAGGKVGDLYDEEDGTFSESEPVVDVPKEVSRRRGLEALFDMYRLKDTDVETAIVQHVTDPDAQYKALNEFRTSQTFELERPMVVFMCNVLGLDRPALFVYAAGLP